MPNFHTHWLVALGVVDQLPEQFGYLSFGRRVYQKTSAMLAEGIRKEVASIYARHDIDAAGNLQETIRKKVAAWRLSLLDDEAAVCFSAFMLGACGPDFWTLPSESSNTIVPDTAGIHFDLGHYNRAHLQFLVSLANVGAGDDGFQARAERAYFLGMATHIGADLILHELVNVSAGAYNLLKFGAAPFKGTWSNEQGYELLSPESSPGAFVAKNAGEVAWLWTTHNKVEHYWDTWVRYRWLGDFGKVWSDDEDRELGLGPKRLPVADTLRRDVLGHTGDWKVAGFGDTAGHYLGDAWRGFKRVLPGDNTHNEQETTKDRLDYVLGSVETRWHLEQPLAFPWLFCDALLAGKLKPFIYARVVEKSHGAYPEALLFGKAKDEAATPQMQDLPPPPSKGEKAPPPPGGKSERKKVQFFSTARNANATPPTSWNYLNFISCPNLDRLLKFGSDKFYDRKAFVPFVERAMDLARAFAMDLATAYSKGEARLPKLGQFWNLDTGLGLQIQNVLQEDGHQAVTRIDWLHALGPQGVNAKLDYERPDPPGYLKSMKAAAEPYPLSAWKDGQRAFETYEAKAAFPDIDHVEEDAAVASGTPPRYLRKLALVDAVPGAPSHPVHDRLKPDFASDAAFEDALFADDGDVPAAECHRAPTGKQVKASSCSVEHRLDLVVRASIAHLGGGHGSVGMYLFGDKAGTLQGSVHEDGEAATEWLRQKSQILDRVLDWDADEASANAGLATFSARILLNLNDDKSLARVVTPKGKWNNVVPYAAHEKHYGRNFAVATARKFVLRGEEHSVPNNFDATTDFSYLKELGLTEHCFFTLYPIVKRGKQWIDAFSKQPVTKSDFQTFKKVDAINFVKIILLYVVHKGALQLGWAYLDGVRVKVPEIRPPAVPVKPPAPPPAVTVTAERIEIPDRIQFEFNQAILRADAYPILDAVAAALASHPEITQVEVQGHTCSSGPAAYNLKLSRDRANAVRQQLIAKGIAPARLVAQGYGEAKPLVSNATPQGREKNRRVEFAILARSG